MKHIENLGDARQTKACAYCGMETQTRDHVPSRVLLDEPFPENLPVVPACLHCNNTASLDEEYLACLIECVICGTTDPEKVSREKIRRTLARQPALQDRLASALKWENGQSLFQIEPDRVERLVIKLARGHALYELNEPQLAEPLGVGISPLSLLSDEMRESFENLSEHGFALWPEVGSRAMQRLVRKEPSWIEVQPGRYRYLATVDTVIRVRLVLSEYLACEVLWDLGEAS